MNVTFPHGQHKSLLEFAATVMQSEGFMNDAVAIAAKHKDELFAVAVYQNRTSRTVDLHFGSIDQRWANRTIISSMLTYGFHHLGHDQINVQFATTDNASIIAALKTGFQPTGYLKSGATNGSDVMMMALKADELRWPPRRNAAHPDKQTAMPNEHG